MTPEQQTPASVVERLRAPHGSAYRFIAADMIERLSAEREAVSDGGNRGPAGAVMDALWPIMGGKYVCPACGQGYGAARLPEGERPPRPPMPAGVKP
jgi:hypothetical protein